MVPHTVVVDFAVALLVTSVACDLLSLLAEEDEFRIVAHWTLVFGALAAAFSALSGYTAYSVAAPTGDAELIVLRHRNLGLTTLACVVAAAGWRIKNHGQLPVRFQGAYWALIGGGLLALVVTAYLGGTAVFRYGVGVNPIG